MKILRTINRCWHIQRAVKQAEKKFETSLPLPGRIKLHLQGIFYPCGPRRPIYRATSPLALSQLLDTLNLPKNFHFADLGSGLGMACFVAASCFNKVTGYEIDSRLVAEAERIRQQLRITNVEFKNEDFLNISLKPFNVIYFYLPFADNFYQLMGQKLREASPGTIVISRFFMHRDLFPAEFFDSYNPFERCEKFPGPLSFFIADFNTWIRK